MTSCLEYLSAVWLLHVRTKVGLHGMAWHVQSASLVKSGSPALMTYCPSSHVARLLHEPHLDIGLRLVDTPEPEPLAGCQSSSSSGRNTNTPEYKTPRRILEITRVVAGVRQN